MLVESPLLLLDEIGEWLAIYHGQPISTTALHDNLMDLGCTYKGLKRIAAEQDNGYHTDWLHFFARLVSRVTMSGGVSSESPSTPFPLCFVGVFVVLLDFFFFDDGASSASDNGPSSGQRLRLSTDGGIRILRALALLEIP